MDFETTTQDKQGRVIRVVVTPIEGEQAFRDKRIKDARAYCFCGDKFVLVWAKDHWNTPGGALEVGENPRDAARREVQEETNMKVLKQSFIFLQAYSILDLPSDDERKTSYQTVLVCLVEPYGDFHVDPDGDITEIKLINPKDYKQYLDWGERGDILMERALDIKRQMDLEVNYGR
jgi:8-oxo-dGTP pyrophosphatase MutT (NUDIX family)